MSGELQVTFWHDTNNVWTVTTNRLNVGCQTHDLQSIEECLRSFLTEQNLQKLLDVAVQKLTDAEGDTHASGS